METACSQKCLDLDSMAFAHREGHTFLGGYTEGPKLETTEWRQRLNSIRDPVIPVNEFR